jgi:hypothetical protein
VAQNREEAETRLPQDGHRRVSDAPQFEQNVAVSATSDEHDEQAGMREIIARHPTAEAKRAYIAIRLGALERPPRLVRATGVETFETVASGEPTTETAEPGEVVWRDDRGITCRGWNWRQCVRTRLTVDTVDALFILDGLAATGRTGLLQAGTDLVARLKNANPGVTINSRLIAPPDPHTEETE